MRLCETEICDSRVSILPYKQILRFDVSVDDFVVVEVLYAEQYL